MLSTVLLNCFLPTVWVSLELPSSEHKQVRIFLVISQPNTSKLSALQEFAQYLGVTFDEFRLFACTVIFFENV